ncbi:GRAM domain-containing protein 2B-like [Micropterus salmoides]|uniref:GRAM domain-containing protein 2B-like n=1 Tax=Micropterus salmoides TaxID=27706 RepID=UPI0018EC5AEC|nr:GRAM domain-containing protein 2B-like [Micropterus salmoides]XP_038550768.1 GRAM domain-containing protein 2B-like [Micropterus salmoides]
MAGLKSIISDNKHRTCFLCTPKQLSIFEHFSFFPLKSFLKHNKTFHKLFQEIPEGENLIHSFTCALQKEVLYHGKLFVSENHVCFHSSVLLKDTKVVIPVSSVRDVKKYNSALSMLSIQTVGEKYSFVSLRHREMCYKLLQTVSLHEQVESSTHPSSENEADHDLGSSYSSLEDCADHDLSRQQNIFLITAFLRCPVKVLQEAIPPVKTA